jgi:NitT/TauT family transport system ATP-binding protein
MQNETIVEVKGIGKTYEGGVEALRDVVLALPRGQLSTLLGPSGCGKTTLLKIIAGLIPPDAGEVWVKGRKVQGPGPERAFVFQDFALLPWANVLRNVAFGLELRGIPRDVRNEVARRHIAEVGLAGFEGSYPNQLSGGMKQRVGLARALATGPEVLLMDEPFAALDAQTRDIMQAELLRIWQEERKTVLFVTHQIEEAVYLSDKVIVMSKRPGRVKSIIDVDLPRPRDYELRVSHAFNELKLAIWNELKDEISPHGEH